MKNNNNKSDYELTLLNIRKILNKITKQTYSKLKSEFICYYKSLISDKYKIIKLSYKEIMFENKDIIKYNNSDEFDKINLFIFENLTFNNIIFADLYCDLFKSLSVINKNFLFILNDNLETFINIINSIKINTNISSCDEILINNKHNDKYKCFCAFYISCLKSKILDINNLLLTLKNILNKLLENITFENNKEYCEELCEIFLFIIKNSYEIIEYKDTDICNYIINNIKLLSTCKVSNYLSISNKIIFKFMDIKEKYNFAS